MTEQEMIDLLLYIRYSCFNIEQAEKECDEALVKLGVKPL